ncbi:MAG: SsrA-binding protein, partial [Actinomycetota bacterium]|nr:SsrA-binding protein [Actinomycetota bacterium]
HEAERERKLLLHRAQIDDLRRRMETDHLTLVPLSIYFRDGRAKVELGLARGRKRHDKRHAIAERDVRRDIDRAVAARHVR